MQGIIAISGLGSGSGANDKVGVTLDNGSYIVTPGDAVYVAPWYAVVGAGADQTAAIQMQADMFSIGGTAWSFTARIVFECPVDEIRGTVWRSSPDAGVQVILPPQHFEFQPGQTEIPFAIKFWPVNDPRVELAAPEWASALLQRRA